MNIYDCPTATPINYSAKTEKLIQKAKSKKTDLYSLQYISIIVIAQKKKKAHYNYNKVREEAVKRKMFCDI